MSYFEKVSKKQFVESCKKLGFNFCDEVFDWIYDDIKLPQRATERSAGYDFYAPFSFSLGGIAVKDSNNCVYDEINYNYVTIPTGIRFVYEEGDGNVFLLCLPRSGQGFKYGVQLANTAGVIDSDYCESDNEGHIMLKITSEFPVTINAGNACMQGIIVPYMTTSNDNTTDKRNGGFGSTDAK